MKLNQQDIIDKVLNADRVALSRLITLAESLKPEHQKLAVEIVRGLQAQSKRRARIISISGPPGVGKSTFIESLGLELIKLKRRVAILAIDPTSSISGGSILGDRTRMEELSKHEQAFIRPSPSGQHLGGVAAKTREACLICEAAGFDDIIIETVGVGQSEFEAKHLSDMMILMAQAASGDDLQGIKRGIMEMADLIIVNKADGSTKKFAQQTKTYLMGALNMGLSMSEIDVVLCSSLERSGFVEILNKIDSYFSSKHDEINKQRVQQKSFWLKELYIARIRQFWSEAENQEYWKATQSRVLAGDIDVWQGSEQLFDRLKKNR